MHKDNDDTNNTPDKVHVESNPHIKLAGVQVMPTVGKEGWEKRLGIELVQTKHHVFTQKWLRVLTPSVLEMYGHQVECVREIIRYEHKLVEEIKSHSKGIFDYILSIREDLYFFQRVYMMRDLLQGHMQIPSHQQSVSTPILAQRKLSPSHHPSTSHHELFPILDDVTVYNYLLYEDYLNRYAPLFDAWNELDRKNIELWNTSSPQDSTSTNATVSTRPENIHKRCQFLSKDCLKWSGVNIRFELYDRLTGLAILQSRISYYKYLWVKNRQLWNPEDFDLSQVSNLHANMCEVNSIVLPLTVSRLQKNEYCFEKDEIFHQQDNCYPLDYHDFIYSHWCESQ